MTNIIIPNFIKTTNIDLPSISPIFLLLETPIVNLFLHSKTPNPSYLVYIIVSYFAKYARNIHIIITFTQVDPRKEKKWLRWLMACREYLICTPPTNALFFPAVLIIPYKFKKSWSCITLWEKLDHFTRCLVTLADEVIKEQISMQKMAQNLIPVRALVSAFDFSLKNMLDDFKFLAI